MPETIFARASGAPPAAIAIIRISGPSTRMAIGSLTGSAPDDGRLALRKLRDGQGDVLDEAMVVLSSAPATVTGEDYAEIHCHGGRAVVAAVEKALAALPDLRLAEPGEFTRRGVMNGKLDLAQAEALADLLQAETELQRRFAIGGVGGSLSRRVEDWREKVLTLSAMVEAALDFSDDEDSSELAPEFFAIRDDLAKSLADALTMPSAEHIGAGYRVTIAGPPNSGKSTLFNRLLDDDAAIVSEVPGTTRDVLERRISIEGLPIVLQDTAGLRSETDDPLEALGMDRTRSSLSRSDLVLWTGASEDLPEGAIQLATKADLGHFNPGLPVSAYTGEGLQSLSAVVAGKARNVLAIGEYSLTSRQRALVDSAASNLESGVDDLLLIAESLRRVRTSFDAVVGRTGTDEVLGTILSRFCIGK